MWIDDREVDVLVMDDLHRAAPVIRFADHHQVGVVRDGGHDPPALELAVVEDEQPDCGGRRRARPSLLHAVFPPCSAPAVRLVTHPGPYPTWACEGAACRRRSAPGAGARWRAGGARAPASGAGAPEQPDLGDLDALLAGRQARDPHEVVALAPAVRVQLHPGAGFVLLEGLELVEAGELRRRVAVRRGVDRPTPALGRRDDVELARRDARL